MARYDGLADWYDAYIRGEAAGFTAAVGDALARMLGRGSGACLDVGRGTGLHLSQARALGWSVTGVDVSEDQLRVACGRLGDSAELVRASGSSLPFAAGRLQAAYATLIHTDVVDIGAVFAEIARVLVDGGRFVYIGTHPCFIAPFIEQAGDGTHIVHPSYLQERRHEHGRASAPGSAPASEPSTTR